MKTEKFQLRSKKSVCMTAFQLLRSRAPVQLRGNIAVIYALKIVIFVQAARICAWTYKYKHKL
jgi:hypothetical protein